MTIEALYPTPLYYGFVDNFKKIQSEIDKCIDDIPFKMKEWGSTHYLHPTTFEENVFDTYKLNSLSEEIHKHLAQYCFQIKFPMTKYNVRSWFTKFERSHYAHVHNHGFTDISGVYYYKTSGDDGDILFNSPNPFLDTSKCFFNIQPSWTHKPVEGKILLFPGWLRHGVATNETDNTRISISFNIYFP